jgi:hypothetical protein
MAVDGAAIFLDLFTTSVYASRHPCAAIGGDYRALGCERLS